MNSKLAIGIATLALSALAGSAAAQVSLGTSYSQNFDGLAGVTSWTNNSTLSGWSWFAAGTANWNGAASGTTTAAGIYNVGATTSSADRSLGAIITNAVGNTAFSLVLSRSASLRPVTGMTISYNGEQWRNQNTASQILTVGYQTFSSAPTTTGQLGPAATGYTALNGLQFGSLVMGGSASAVDGNGIGRLARSTSISGSSVILDGSTFLALRWLDVNDQNNDHTLTIDDLSITDLVLTNAAPSASNFSTTINAGDQPYSVDLFSLLADSDISAAWGETFTYSGTGDAGFSLTGSTLSLSGVNNGTYTYLFTATDSQNATTALASVTITVIPTPGAAALMGLGTLAIARRRRA